MDDATNGGTSRSLATAHNEVCVVLKLPNELLVRIVEALPPPVFNGPRFDGASYPAFSLSHTCRWWRTFVLDYPRCWRWIPCTNSHWLKEGLCRSSGALLRLHIDIDYQHHDSLRPNIPVLSEHAWRVEAVILGNRDGGRPSRGPYAYHNRPLLEFLRSNKFPVMRELVLAQWRDHHHISSMRQIFIDDAPPLLESVFISYINLRNREVFLQSPLTRFEIVGGAVGASMDEIIDFFRAVPQLEIFIARETWCLNRNSSNVHQPEPNAYAPHSIPLIHLKEFVVGGAFDDGLAVFNILAISTHCSVRISSRRTERLRYQSTRVNDWSTAPDALSNHFAAIPAAALAPSASHVDIHYQHLHAGVVSLTEVAFKVSYVLEPASSRVVSLELVFHVDDEQMGRSFRTATFYNRLAPHLFSAAHTARIDLSDIDYSDSSSDIQDALAEMPALRTLTLAGSRAGKVLTPDGSPHFSLCKTLPYLRTLVLSEMNFSTEFSAPVLSAALQPYAGMPSILKTVHIEDCVGLTSADLSTLRGSLEGVSIECSEVKTGLDEREG